MKISKYLLVLGFSVLLLIVYITRSNSLGPKPLTGKTKVVTSFYPLFYFTKEIGKDKLDLTNITPAGVEPHDYEPTPTDVVKIENSQLLVLNGSIEAWGERIKNQLTNKNTLVIETGAGLFDKELEEDGKKIRDPHVWLDTIRAKSQVDAITKALEDIDPVNRDFYTANSVELKEKLDSLNTVFKNGLSSCVRSEFVTSHEAFGYLASRYDLNQIAVSGISPDEEPSSAKLAEIVKIVKAKGIKYIFFESLVSPKLSETIAQEVGAKTLVLDPLEGITDNGIKKGRDYISIMNDNLNNLRIALECK